MGGKGGKQAVSGGPGVGEKVRLPTAGLCFAIMDDEHCFDHLGLKPFASHI